MHCQAGHCCETCLHHFCTWQRQASYELWFRRKESKSNQPSSAGRTPLHYAAMHGRLGAIEALVKAGASVNRKDMQGGFTPMHLAADAGQCEAMEALLQAGATLEPRSSQGWTPLGLATLKVLQHLRGPLRWMNADCQLELHPFVCLHVS